jgi:molybdate transport repressor ModE-like protein
MPKLTLRIDFDTDRAIGPGKVKLLEMIDKYGSISEAGRQMGMSYRRAWLLVDSLNRSFRVPVIASKVGQSPRGSQVRRGLAAGGNEIRTIGPRKRISVFRKPLRPTFPPGEAVSLRNLPFLVQA